MGRTGWADGRADRRTGGLGLRAGTRIGGQVDRGGRADDGFLKVKLLI